MDNILKLNGIVGGIPKLCSNGRVYFSLAVHPKPGTTVWVSCFAAETIPGLSDIDKGSRLSLEGFDLGNEMNAKGETQKKLNVRCLLALLPPLVKREPGTEPAKNWQEGETHNQEIVLTPNEETQQG